MHGLPPHCLGLIVILGSGAFITQCKSGFPMVDDIFRPGGLFAGHDYAPEWPKNVAAVDGFHEVAGIAEERFWVTTEGRYPSWGVAG